MKNIKDKTNKLDNFFKLYGGIINTKSVINVIDNNYKIQSTNTWLQFYEKFNNCKNPQHFLHIYTKANSVVTIGFKDKKECAYYKPIILSKLLLGLDVVNSDMKSK